MLYFNLGVERHIQNPQVIRDGIRISRAEAFTMNSLLGDDSIRRQAVFAPKGTYEFYVVCKTPWCGHGFVAIGIQPEMLIGLGDGKYQFLPDPPPNSKVPFGVPVQNGNYENGQILYRNQFEHQGFNQDGDPYRYYQFCIQDILAKFPRTQEGFILPLLGLYAIKLSAMHGIRYTVEMANDEIYHLGFVAEPDFNKVEDSSLPSPMMPAEVWTPTTPELDTYRLKAKYKSCNMNVIQGKYKDIFSLIVKLGVGMLQPISFWRCALRPFPITLPCPHTPHTPLYKLDRAYESPLYMTEYPEVADANSDGDMPMASWIGGEMNLKYADFAPLNGRQVIYLLLNAVDDETGERAYRVMLKAFSRAYQCGNRNFECLDWDNQKTIPYETLLSQAVEHGYLKIEGQSTDFKKLMASALPWATRKPGVHLFGRVFQSGRIHLVVAARGVGKTEMLVLFSVMAVHAASFDKAFFENRYGKPIRVLYIQREMNIEADFEDRIKDAEKLLRRIAPDAVAPTSSNDIDFYEPENSLVEAEEQCKVLNKLAELDPDGASQWMLVIDNLKTEMPEVLKGGNIFREQVYPWLDFLRKKGVAISLLHHDNQTGDISGPGSIQDLSDVVFHIVRTGKKTINGEADVHILLDDKPRLLKGNQQATAHWNWVTDEKLGITRFLSEYLDDNDAGTKDAPMPAEQCEAKPDAPVPEPQVTEKKVEPVKPRLPASLTELQVMPHEKMEVALFELWEMHGTQEAIADALGCSKSSIAPLMRDCGVNKDTYQEYLKKRNGYA